MWYKLSKKRKIRDIFCIWIAPGWWNPSIAPFCLLNYIQSRRSVVYGAGGRHVPMWRNWYTRTTQNRVNASSCGFDSHHRHQRVRLPTARRNVITGRSPFHSKSGGGTLAPGTIRLFMISQYWREMNDPIFNEDDIKELFDTKQNPPASEKPLKVAYQPAKNVPIVSLKPKTAQALKAVAAPAPKTKTAQPPNKGLEVAKSFWQVFFKFLSIFILLFVISFTIINGPALILKMKYFWEVDYRHEAWNKDFSPAQITLTNKQESRLTIPKIKVDAPIIWNVPGNQIVENLQNGVAHYLGTATPGQQGNIFITGHSSYYLWAPGNYKDVFALLGKLDAGDKIYISYQGEVFTYEVTDRKVVSPQEMSVLTDNPNNTNNLSLMTCVPVGTNLNRLIITAKQI